MGSYTACTSLTLRNAGEAIEDLLLDGTQLRIGPIEDGGERSVASVGSRTGGEDREAFIEVLGQVL